MTSDLLWIDDLDPMGAEVDSKGALFQDNYHRMIEGKGSNIDDPDRGVGVFSWLNAPIEPSYRHLVERELLRDDRNETVTAQVTGADADTFKIETEYTYDGETVGIEVDGDGLVTT